MMRWKVAAKGTLLTLVLFACSKEEGPYVYSIDGQRFEVPKEYVLPSQVELYQGSNEAKSLVFSSDPTAPLVDQFSVTLESKKTTCRPDKIAAASMLAVVCEKSASPLPPVDIESLQKERLFPGSKTLWVYTAAGADGTRVTVASCYAAVASESGDTCSAFGSHGALVYSFSLRDLDIRQLNDRRARIESLLAAWAR